MERDFERAGLEGSLPLSEPGGPEKGTIHNQISATNKAAALWVRAVLKFYPLEKNVITQFSDSCGWKLQRLSQAGLQPWERGRRGHAVRGTGGALAALSGLLIITCTPKKPAECQGSSQLAVCILGEKKEECRQSGNVEFRNLSPKRFPVGCVSSSEAALRSRAAQAGGQLSCSTG